MDSANEIRKNTKKIEKAQDAKRFEHTLGVEYTAAALAMCYGASVEDARLAGLLHDCAKCLTDEKRLSICKKNDIPVTEIEMRNPFLLHAKVGAFLAKEKYGVGKQDILNAILYHTTGHENMTLLEKIIFVADYIEPGRKQAPNLLEIRKLAFQNLDNAMLQILEDTLKYLQSGGGETDPMTEITWRYYKEKREEERRVYGKQ